MDFQRLPVLRIHLHYCKIRKTATHRTTHMATEREGRSSNESPRPSDVRTPWRRTCWWWSLNVKDSQTFARSNIHYLLFAARTQCVPWFIGVSGTCNLILTSTIPFKRAGDCCFEIAVAVATGQRRSDSITNICDCDKGCLTLKHFRNAIKKNS